MGENLTEKNAGSRKLRRIICFFIDEIIDTFDDRFVKFVRGNFELLNCACN